MTRRDDGGRDRHCRRMVIVAYDDAQILDIASPSGALDLANRLGATPPYTIELATHAGRAVESSSGILLGGGRALAGVTGELDTLIVVGGLGHEGAAGDTELVAQVRRLAERSRRIASVCTGATVLAATGLLDGRRVTTHWSHGDALAARYPQVTVDMTPLYIRDGPVYTSAGVTSGLDLTLAMIEEDHGPTLARATARQLVTYLHRPADQSQISLYLAGPPPEDRLVRDLLSHIAAHPDADLTTGALAARAGISSRHLTRLFSAHLRTTPARAVRRARTEAAARLLATSGLPLGAVARRCGFGSTETLRQAFLSHFGVPPSRMRGRVGASADARPAPDPYPAPGPHPAPEPTRYISSSAARAASTKRITDSQKGP